MGATVVAALASSGRRVLWCDDKRSSATMERAADAGAQRCGSLAEFGERCDLIISVCPPEFASEVADGVNNAGFTGAFLDANAISPARCVAIAGLFEERFIDGGIIGPPALRPGTTRLYLAGESAEAVAQVFANSPLEAIAMREAVPAASALKMCYAAWTKGSSALLLSTVALAQSLGVGDALSAEWELSQQGTSRRAAATATGVAPKAWRFAAEMSEIADTYEAADLPRGFHEGAMQLYQALAQFKDSPEASLHEVLGTLLKQQGDD